MWYDPIVESWFVFLGFFFTRWSLSEHNGGEGRGKENVGERGFVLFWDWRGEREKREREDVSDDVLEGREGENAMCRGGVDRWKG